MLSLGDFCLLQYFKPRLLAKIETLANSQELWDTSSCHRWQQSFSLLIIIHCNLTFPASDRLSQTNNAMAGALIQSKRIIRTIYGRSRRSTGQIHEAQCTLKPVRRWFAGEGGLWICGAELNWIAFMGRKTPTIAMKNLWILFRSK